MSRYSPRPVDRNQCQRKSYYYVAGSILCVRSRYERRAQKVLPHSATECFAVGFNGHRTDVPHKLIASRSKRKMNIFHKKINFKRNVSQLFLVSPPRRRFNYTVHRFSLPGGPESGEFKYCYTPHKIIIITISNGPYNCIYYHCYLCPNKKLQ